MNLTFEDLPTIKRLDQATVNRIAAGEVIHRPANALKELLENSIDAGSTQIGVLAKDGGLKLLQVTDDGHGIRKDDLAIAVERFTTSKLQQYEDLATIQTFGFRGEALASMSHVAHLTITTMVADSPCAYRACYCDSRMVPHRDGGPAEPRPCAGVKGTVVTIEDVFYNVPSRRKALKNPSEEYQKIVEVVGRYAIRYPHIGFTCKRAGENAADVRTPGGAAACSLDGLRAIYGPALARELLPLEARNEALGVSLDGHISNANYSSKRMVLILFINGRLVECGPLKKAAEQAYLPYLPKGSHPFLYLSLAFPPQNLDVNVHPTKQEVRFLDEEQVVDFVQAELDARLVGANASRVFYTQTLLPGTAAPDDADEDTGGKDDECTDAATTTARRKTAAPVPHKQVRVTPVTEFGQLDAFVCRVPGATDRSQSRVSSKRPRGEAASPLVPARKAVADPEDDADLPPAVRKRSRSHRPSELTSVQALLAACDARAHAGLSDLIREHVFVGMASERLALLQHSTKLYLVDLAPVTKEAFYQMSLRRHGDVDRIALRPPAPVRTLVRAALDSPDAGWRAADGDKDDIAAFACKLLAEEKGEMLGCYFGMQFDAARGTLETLPELIDNYLPPLDLLPLFLLRLAVEVDWDSEQGCFDTVARELGELYSVRPGHIAGALPPDLRKYVPVDPARRFTRPPPVASAPPSALVTPVDAAAGGFAAPEQPGEVGVLAAAAATTVTTATVRQEEVAAAEGARPPTPPTPQAPAAEVKDAVEEESGKSGQGGGAGCGDSWAAKEGGKEQSEAEWRWCVRHVLLPGLRHSLTPSKRMATDGTVVQLVCTSQLYRVFERC